MDDRSFTELLDSISKKDVDIEEKYKEFLETLFKGYREGLGIMSAYVSYNGNDMLMLGGDSEKRVILSFTKRENFFHFKKRIAPEAQRDARCGIFSCRQIINNILDDPTISGISFNVFMDNYVSLLRDYFVLANKNGFLERLEPNTH